MNLGARFERGLLLSPVTIKVKSESGLKPEQVLAAWQSNATFLDARDFAIRCQNRVPVKSRRHSYRRDDTDYFARGGLTCESFEETFWLPERAIMTALLGRWRNRSPQGPRVLRLDTDGTYTEIYHSSGQETRDRLEEGSYWVDGEIIGFRSERRKTVTFWRFSLKEDLLKLVHDGYGDFRSVRQYQRIGSSRP